MSLTYDFITLRVGLGSIGLASYKHSLEIKPKIYLFGINVQKFNGFFLDAMVCHTPLDTLYMLKTLTILPIALV